MSVQMLEGMLDPENQYTSDDGLEEGEIPCFQSPFSFLNLLQEVVLGSLAEDDQSCGICREPYGTGEIPETILILPCKHMFGSSCIHHWLGVSNKNTCPSCRTVLFEIDNDLDADDDYQAEPEIRSLLMTGSDYDFISAFQLVDHLIQAFPTLLRANQASWNREGPPVSVTQNIPISGGRFVLASVQLLALFKEISRRGFCIPQQYIDRLGSLMGRLAHDLREILQEMRVVMMWSVHGLPTRLLCDPQCRGMIMIAMDQMIDAEENWVMGNFSIDAEIEDYLIDRRAQDRQWSGWGA